MAKPQVNAVLLMGACIVGCARHKQNNEQAAALNFDRGDHVVVESSAAKFYEAQVIAVDNAKLRVQSLPSGDSALVPVSDVYRLPSNPAALSQGSLAICSTQLERWFGCRILSANADGAKVVDSGDVTHQLSWKQIIQPSALTDLNLKRLFDKASERHEFEQELSQAGVPKTIPGWRPAPGKSVLARVDGNWLLAIVSSEKHGKVRLRFPASDRQLEVSIADLAAEPPYPMELSIKSRFALLRPTNPSQPWVTVRLVSVDALEAAVEGVGTKRRVVPVRDVCPLDTVR